jgi:ABC-type sugar transport system substrate-binding protein
MTDTRTIRRRHRARHSLALLAAGALFVAAGGGATGATDSTDTSDAESGSTDVERAAQIVEELSQRPTAIDLDTPIEGEIPTGLDIYYIPCGTAFCDAEEAVIQEGADILGWNLTALSNDGSPEEVQAAWERIIADQPDGVLYNATPRSLIGDYIEQAAANGTVVTARSIAEPAENGIVWSISTPEQVGALAEPMAAWIVNDAAQADNFTPGAVYLDLPEFPILTSLRTEFIASMGDLCPDCRVEALDFGLSDLGTAADEVVSFLRSNPDVTYVVNSADSAFAGVPAALSATGLDDVRVFGEGPDPAVLAMIAAGDQDATMAFALYESVFGMLDAIARSYAGDEIIPSFSPPNWILTADNLPSTTEFFPLVPDIVDHFRELWGK